MSEPSAQAWTEVGTRIRDAIRRNLWTYQDASVESGVSIRTIQSIASGEVTGRQAAKLKKLWASVGLDPAELGAILYGDETDGDNPVTRSNP